MENHPAKPEFRFSDVTKTFPQELPSYVIPYLICFIFPLVNSGFFKDEKRFVNIVTSRINPDMKTDLFSMLVTILIVVAIVFLLDRVLPFGKSALTNRAIIEVSKIFYLLGSTFAGTITSVLVFAWYTGNDPKIPMSTYITANVLGLLLFGIGATAKFFLEQKHKQTA
ncbi:MAG: hypothetical protein IPN71_12500 [Fibrobacteres bacterium]|nr:hypothetical protein [Fibrobacterota bacterium]